MLQKQPSRAMGAKGTQSNQQQLAATTKQTQRSLNTSMNDDYDDGVSPSKYYQQQTIQSPVPEEPAELTLQQMQDDDGEGLFIVENGTCKIVHRYDQFEVRELRRWDFFGESDLLKVIVSIIL
jgi:CRP-like cAMP-binding protein